MNSTEVVELSRCRSLVASGAARSIREAAGLSLSEVAGAVGVSKAAIMLWERGDRVPRGAPALAYGRLLQELMRGHSRERVTA